MPQPVWTPDKPMSRPIPNSPLATTSPPPINEAPVLSPRGGGDGGLSEEGRGGEWVIHHVLGLRMDIDLSNGPLGRGGL